MRISVAILSFFILLSCGQKGRINSNTATIADIVEPEYSGDDINPAGSDSPFLIVVPADLEMNEQQFDYVELLDDHTEDTLGVGMLSSNGSYEVGLLRQLKLGEKWLCIMFPNAAYNRTETEVDTLRTTEHVLNDYPQDYYITLLSVKDKERNRRVLVDLVEDESLLDYNIAFRGDYDISDFHYYTKKAISGNDSMHITAIIRNALQDGRLKKPQYLPTDSLHLVEMYGLKEDLYVAKYKPEYVDDVSGGYTKGYSVFLIKNNKVLLWDSGDYSIALEVFSLKGQDYVWVEEVAYATSFTDLYRLDDRLQGIYHSTFTGD